MQSLVRKVVLSSFLSLLLASVMASPSWGQPYQEGAIIDQVETSYGPIYRIHRSQKPVRRGTLSFVGDTYDFQHQVGALIDGVFQCLSPHMSGTEDNTVLFDGLTELLDPYLDGTQPSIFEFESQSSGPTGEIDVFMNSFSDGGDLFPEGFEDPETGTPLTDACLEIGKVDTLDSNQPNEVLSAIFEASNTSGPILGPIDIASFFENPFDGRISVVFPGAAGSDIDGTTLQMEHQPFDPAPIFADGFESGDATAWN